MKSYIIGSLVAWKVMDFTFAFLCAISGVYYIFHGYYIFGCVYILSSIICGLSGVYDWGYKLTTWLIREYTRILKRLAIMSLLHRGL